MSMIACIIPYENGSFDEGNIVRCYPWRVGTNGIEIRAGAGGHNDGWVDAANPITNDQTLLRFLFVEVEDSVGNDLQEYVGKKRGRFNWKAKFTDPTFKAKVRDTSKHVSAQMGKGIKKSDIAKGPDWGKPRDK